MLLGRMAAWFKSCTQLPTARMLAAGTPFKAAHSVRSLLEFLWTAPASGGRGGVPPVLWEVAAALRGGAAAPAAWRLLASSFLRSVLLRRTLEGVAHEFQLPGRLQAAAASASAAAALGACCICKQPAQAYLPKSLNAVAPSPNPQPSALRRSAWSCPAPTVCCTIS